MKRFLLVALLLVSAASVYAADLKITGDAEVRGVINNAAYDGDAVWKDKFFDADFNFNCALVLTENTTVFTKLTIDTENNQGVGLVPDSLATDAVSTLGVERAYISTKFLPALTVDAGVMAGGMWGTAFGNTEINVTRIKATYAVSEDIKVMAIYEKYAESNEETFQAGFNAQKDAIWQRAYDAAIAGGATEAVAEATADGTISTLEAAYDAEVSDTSDYGDTTAYYLAATIKSGAFTISPLFKYQEKQTDREVYNRIQDAAGRPRSDAAPYAMSFDLAVTGDMGMVGFEAEVIYIMTKMDDLGGAEDLTTYGAYVDVFAKTEMAKAGVALFYESADEKKGIAAAGEDFDFTLIYEDMLMENIAGMMAGKVYASDIKIVDKISADVAFAYGMQTDKDVNIDSDFAEITFWEVDAGINYAIDAATTYTVEGGYANIDTSAEALTAYQVVQKIAVKF